LYEVYELCFTVCLLQLLLFASSCMKSMSCVSQFVYYSYYFLSALVWSLWVVFHSLFTTVITFCQFLYEVYELCFTVCLRPTVFSFILTAIQVTVILHPTSDLRYFFLKSYLWHTESSYYFCCCCKQYANIFISHNGKPFESLNLVMFIKWSSFFNFSFEIIVY
jgi:hypothetical protein